MKNEIILFYNSLLNFNIWKELADTKMRARYNRTVLGPFWEIIGSLFLLLLFDIPIMLAPKLDKSLARFPPIKPLIPVIKIVLFFQNFLDI